MKCFINDYVYIVVKNELKHPKPLAQSFKANEPSGVYVSIWLYSIRMWPSHSMLSMKVLRGTSCVTRSTMLVLWCVCGGSGVTEVWRKRGGVGRGSWNCDWRHLVIITHLCSNLDFFRTHSPPGLLFYVLFLSSPLCAKLSYIRHWHVFPELVLLLIRLVLENQTKHDTALHHLAWWCHDIINTLLQLRPHLPPSTCQGLVSHGQVCV